jgi:asparagine synthase (glutamine-hydrolysing)
MCGIYGMIALSGRQLRHPEMLDSMGQALCHRGPDGHAVFTSAAAAVGTERLRIIDLHERADQPFAAPGSQVWLECNGEIYNAAAIRAMFPDYPYRSRSDVETIIPLFLQDGTGAIPQLDGMFGLAIWDNRTQALILARDRAGEKPLFYARVDGEIWFASELQSLLRNPEMDRSIDREALAAYLRMGYVPEPLTMFRAIRRVPAGAFLRFREGSEELTRYWEPGAFAVESRGAAAATSELRALIEAAVTKQVISDVPVGVFISGGLDSSILATLAARVIGAGRVHTFSARFAEASFDESDSAARLAASLHTQHVPVPTNEETLREALSAVVTGLAEPLADPAILPTFLLARAARQHVKVILSGEGADELFGGYPTYIGHKLAPLYHALPSPLRSFIRQRVESLPSSSRKVTFEFLLKKFVADVERPWIERHLSWFGTGLPPDVLLGQNGLPAIDTSPGRDALTGAMLLDYQSYLRDNLLVKVDRATMLSSVEARAPFLDRDVSAFALSLSANMRVRRLTTKWLLKRAAESWLPQSIIHARKRGLSVPIATWINHGLRGEVDRLLDAGHLRQQGLLDPVVVERLLSEHRSGRANHARPLWPLIVLQYWFENWT